MKIVDCKMKLLNMKGDPLENEEKKPVILGTVLSNVLAGKTDNPALAWVLGKKFATEDEVDLLAEEVVFVKGEITKCGTNPNHWLSGLLCGQILTILDTTDKPVEKAVEKVEKTAKK